MSSETAAPAVPFSALGLSAPVQAALVAVGYESPSPIQAATIPAMLAGRDVLGTAQTGTGKTAAFALPVLSNLDLSAGKPQVLVLAPTRELAIQVAEAFQKYAAKIPGFHVLPIYGGQSYYPQLQALKQGLHAREPSNAVLPLRVANADPVLQQFDFEPLPASRGQVSHWLLQLRDPD